MKRSHVGAAAIVGLVVGLASCYPGDPTTTSQLDVIATVHDDSVDFSAIQTFAIPDSIIHLELGENPIDLDRSLDDAILTRVKENLEALGYVEEPDPGNNAPDVVVLVAAAASETTTYYLTYPWWSYWGWYPYWPCCGPGWGIGYPPFGGSVTYEQGTLFIDMIDARNPNTSEEEVLSIWVAAARGLLGSSASNQNRVLSAIDQAFDQSPYLGR